MSPGLTLCKFQNSKGYIIFGLESRAKPTNLYPLIDAYYQVYPGLS
jgi:hypothetical protein